MGKRMVSLIPKGKKPVLINSSFREVRTPFEIMIYELVITHYYLNISKKFCTMHHATTIKLLRP